jgi:thiamine biosynthesis lipoprotein ApbE
MAVPGGANLAASAIDPTTGQPSNAHSASATVVAVSAWRVEFLAKAAVLGPTAADAE